MKCKQILNPIIFLLMCFAAAVSAQKKDTVSINIPEPKPAAETENEKPNFTDFEYAVFRELNEARTNPQKFIAYLETYKKSLRNNTLILPDGNRIVMVEGAPAIDDAIQDLKNVAPLNPLSVSNGLSNVAGAQLSDLKENISLSHRGKDGSLLDARMLKSGTVSGEYAENISYGTDKARDIVLAFIIDDGVKSRAHRKNVFSSNFKIFGIGCGKEKRGEFLCVTEFAEQFREWDKSLGAVKSF